MIICSQCGTPKREVNHWYLVWAEREGKRFCVVRWEDDPTLESEEDVYKVCGQNCVTKALSSWMELVKG